MQNALTLEHVKASQLPSSWIKRLHASPFQKFTVKIVPEPIVGWDEFATFRKTFGTKTFPPSAKIIRSMREDK